MRIISLLLSLATLVLAPLCTSSLWAETDHSENALKVLSENVREYTLSNGMKVILYRRGVAPVFAGIVATRVGGSDELPGDTGISHMLEHMAFKGTPEIGTSDYSRERRLLAELEEIVRDGRPLDAFTPEERSRWEAIHKELATLWDKAAFMREFEKRGASDLNATTDKELTRYFTNMPRPAFEAWAWMESERLLHPVMRQFYQERDVVLEERRMRSEDDPMGKLYEMMLGVVYLKHPYRNPVIGYEDDIKRLTASRLEEFRKRYYVPGNIVVSVVGDIHPEEDLKTLEKYFGRLPVGPVPGRPSIVEGVQGGERSVVYRTKSSPSAIIAYRKTQYPHPDDAPVSIMAEILAGNSVAPLYTELVKKRQIAASIGNDEGPGVSYPNLLLFVLTPKSPHTNEDVIRGFDEVIERFKVRGPTEEELAIAKRSIATAYVEQMRSNMSLASNFAETELLYGDWRALLTWYEEAMKVTAADVKRVTQQYLIRDARTVARVETQEEKK